jgi:phosphate transport system permease protein
VELPIVARSAQEVLDLVPRSLHEAGLALGLRRWRIVLRIVLPTALGGLITGSVLGVARVAGETAPLLFASSIYSNLAITTNPAQAMPNIPVTIFELSESPSPQDHAQAWAAALVLIAFVLILSVVARTFHERSRRRIRG